MPYAQGRVFYDADSHLMETGDWLRSYADPGLRDRIPDLNLGGGGAMAEQAVADAQVRRHDEQRRAAAEADVMSGKGWSGLGAFDPAERGRALDLLGFDAQLVFSTFAAGQFLANPDEAIRYGGTRAHNRAIADFCSADDRLVAVAWVPLDDPALAAAAVDEAIEFGCGAVQVPSVPPRTHSPTHVALDPVWARLAEAGIPLMLHIGGGGKLLPSAYNNNGRPRPTDWLGGGENLRAKDYMAVAHPVELFLAAMIFDGVLEAHPGLRGGVIEQGAMWVVPLLKRLDMAHRFFAKSDPVLRALPLLPSEYFRRQIRATPFPGEPIGWLIREAGEELFLFSSDYPHPEGGRHPVETFEKTMDGVSEPAKERFYAGNFADMMGMARVAA